MADVSIRSSVKRRQENILLALLTNMLEKKRYVKMLPMASTQALNINHQQSSILENSTILYSYVKSPVWDKLKWPSTHLEHY